MTQQEFRRLRTFELSFKRAFKPSRKVTSRRSAKHPSVGQVLKNSRVVEQVHVDTIFNTWHTYHNKRVV